MYHPNKQYQSIDEILSMFKNLNFSFTKAKISENISFAADLATIFALGIAFIALFNPGLVTNYLQAIDKNTKDIAVSSNAVAKNTDAISASTHMLSEEVPYWLRIEDAGFTINRDNSGRKQTAFRLTLINPTNFPIKGIKVKIVSEKRIIKEYESITIPPYERWHISGRSLQGWIKGICISGTTARLGKEIYEWRTIFHPEVHDRSDYGTSYKDWVLTENPNSNCI